MADHKQIISAEANEALVRMVTAVNKDFREGKINRSELLSWIVLNISSQKFEKQISQIRKDHFDPLLALQALAADASRAKKSGEKFTKLDQVKSLFGEGK